MALSVKEKEYWRERIDRKLRQAVDQLYGQGEGAFRYVIDKEAKQLAIRSLAIADAYSRSQAIQVEIGDLQKKKQRLDDQMTESVKRQIPELRHEYDPIEAGIRRRHEQCRTDLLANDPRGRRILQIEKEREQLFEVILLATSSSQISDLRTHVSQLIEQSLTDLQRGALAIPPDPKPQLA